MHYLFNIPVSLAMANLVLAVLTTVIAAGALCLLVYVVVKKPPSFDRVDKEEKQVGGIEETFVDLSTPPPFHQQHPPSRLRNNNMIRPITSKDLVIDLKGMGMDTNRIIEDNLPRNSREIEAELHLDIERALVESDSNSTLISNIESEEMHEIQEAKLDLTLAPSIPERHSTDRSQEEISTIEPLFEKILAFPDCKRTPEGHRYC